VDLSSGVRIPGGIKTGEVFDLTLSDSSRGPMGGSQGGCYRTQLLSDAAAVMWAVMLSDGRQEHPIIMALVMINSYYFGRLSDYPYWISGIYW
jgi:hypothetical protein